MLVFMEWQGEPSKEAHSLGRELTAFLIAPEFRGSLGSGPHLFSGPLLTAPLPASAPDSKGRAVRTRRRTEVWKPSEPLIPEPQLCQGSSALKRCCHAATLAASEDIPVGALNHRVKSRGQGGEEAEESVALKLLCSLSTLYYFSGRESDPSIRPPAQVLWLFLWQSRAHLPFGSLRRNPGDSSPFTFPLRLLRMCSLDPYAANLARLYCQRQRPVLFSRSPLNVLCLDPSWCLWLVMPF